MKNNTIFNWLKRAVSGLFLISLIFGSFFIVVNNSQAAGKLEASVNPLEVPIGQSVKLTVKFKPNSLTVQEQGLGKSLFVYAVKEGSTSCDLLRLNNCTQLPISNSNFKGDTTTVDLTITSGVYSSAGNGKLLEVAVQSVGEFDAGDAGIISVTPISERTQTSFNLLAGTGGFENAATVSEVYRNTTQENLIISFKVIPPSGKTVQSVTMNCGNGTQGKKNSLGTQNPEVYDCQYFYNAPGEFTAAATIKYSDGTQAQASSLVKVSADEKNSGQTATQNTTQEDEDGGLYGILVKIIGFIFGIINYIIFNVFWYVVAPILQAMLSIRTYTDAFSNVIYPGWEVLRNLANIFFIVSLIFIALATLFRLESYNYKHLLVNLILSALLVNFSLAIGQAILGIADTVQNQFLPNNVVVIRNLGRKLMVEPYQQVFQDKTRAERGEYGNTASLIQLFFMMSLALGSFVVFSAIAVMLVIRVVALWVLLMLSPVPYFSSVLPFTKQFTSQWWSYFIKYAFFSPIMAFFINMTAIIVDNYPRVIDTLLTPGLQQGSSAFANEASVPGLTDFALRVSSNILLLVFLLAGMKAAEQFGIAGAGVATKLVQGGIALPFVAGAGAATFAGKAAGQYVGRKYNEGTQFLADDKEGKWGGLKRLGYAALHPVAEFKAFRHDSEALLKQSEEFKEAAALSIKRQVPGFYRPGEDPLALYKEHKGKELWEEAYGEITGSEQEIVKNALVEAKRSREGNKDSKLMMREFLNIMGAEHNLNEFIPQYSQRFMGLDKPLAYNRANIIGVFEDMVDRKVIDAEVAEDVLKRFTKVGYQVRDINLSELTTTDDQGHVHIPKVEFDAAKNAYRVQGEDVFNRVQDQANEAATAKTPDAVNVEVKRILDTMDETQRKAYRNYETFLSKAQEAMYNLTKSDPIEVVKQWHDSVVTKNPDGKYSLNAAGKRLITTMQGGYEFHGFRGNVNKVALDKLMALMIDHNDDFKDEIIRALKEESRTGIGLSRRRLNEAELKLETLISMYKNMRFAHVSVIRNQGKLESDEYKVKDFTNTDELEAKTKRMLDDLKAFRSGEPHDNGNTPQGGPQP